MTLKEIDSTECPKAGKARVVMRVEESLIRISLACVDRNLVWKLYGKYRALTFTAFQL